MKETIKKCPACGCKTLHVTISQFDRWKCRQCWSCDYHKDSKIKQAKKEKL